MSPEPFRFAGAEIPPGSRRNLEIPAGRLPSGSVLHLPVEIVHGLGRGPTVWLSGAIHGDEIVGVEIIRRVLQEVDPSRLAGALVAAPVVNVFGFVTGSRYLPDRRDLNRSFPGSRTGSLAARLARLFMDQVVARCSFGIDFHAGSDDRTNLPQVRGDLDDPDTRRLALAFGAPLMVHSRPPRGALRHAVLRARKRVLLFEGGEPRRFSSGAVAVGAAGTLRVLQALGMIEEAPPAPDRPPLESRATYWVRAPRGGIVRLDVELGDRVGPGTRIGSVWDPTGRNETPVPSRRGGVVLGRTVNPLVNRGDAVVHLAEV